jgi:hypothetical protein
MLRVEKWLNKIIQLRKEGETILNTNLPKRILV